MRNRRKIVKLFSIFYIQQREEFAKLNKIFSNLVDNTKKSLTSVMKKINK